MGKHMNYDDKAKILIQNAKGYGPSAISKSLKIPKQTIHDFLKRYKKTESILNNYQANKPKSFDERTERRICRYTIAHRRKTTRQIKELLELDCDLKTIRNVLKKNGIRARRPRKKPALDDNQRKVRYDWAKAHENWTIDQ